MRPYNRNSDKEMLSLPRKYVPKLLCVLRATSKDYVAITAATSALGNLRKVTLSSIGYSPGGV